MTFLGTTRHRRLIGFNGRNPAHLDQMIAWAQKRLLRPGLSDARKANLRSIVRGAKLLKRYLRATGRAEYEDGGSGATKVAGAPT
jgi:hypothetical protein